MGSVIASPSTTVPALVRTEHTVWKGATRGGSEENDEMLSSSDLGNRIRCLNRHSGGPGRGPAVLGGPLEEGPRGRVQPGPEVGAGGDGRVVGGPPAGQAAVGPGAAGGRARAPPVHRGPRPPGPRAPAPRRGVPV